MSNQIKNTPETEQEEIEAEEESNDVNIYDTGVANGDPIVAYISGSPGEAVTLGTGFETMNHLIGSVKYAMRTGNGTTHLPSRAAKLMENAEQVDLFTLAATVNEQSTANPNDKS